MLANVLVKAGRPAEALPLLDEAAAHTDPGDGRNASRVHTVRGKAFVVLGNWAAARVEHDRAAGLAAAANADHYQDELADLAAEIDFGDGDVARARSRWGSLAQQCVDAGHPRSAYYFAKLMRTPTTRR
jgi:ATP/maltotriose-dependent transcriptional regulator MalT